VIAALLAACLATASVRDLPLREFPVDDLHGQFAIILTGDGGWRRLDDQIAKRLRENGVPVAGFLIPDFFREQKLPDEAACALERTIRHYQALWKTERVMLIGYSRGADVLPFMASRLPADVRASIDVIAFLGLESSIDFQYHPSWIPLYHPHGAQVSVLPEVRKLNGLNLLCVYGEKEKDTLCRQLSPEEAAIVREKGGHHFAGDYRKIADTILAAAKKK
jgi:type IV secretory pathway VirJ component